MKKLTQEHIADLENHGITIGCNVMCPNTDIVFNVRSWDDFEVSKNSNIASKAKYTKAGLYVWLKYNNTYGTPHIPKKAHSIYEADWSSAPKWANYHLFTRDGLGVWAQFFAIVNNGWIIHGKSRYSGCNLSKSPLDLNIQEAITQRPESKLTALYEVNWSSAPKWANYHAYCENKKGYWYQQLPGEIHEDWYESNYPSKFTLRNGLDWKKSITKRPEPKTNPTPPAEEINLIQVVDELNQMLFEAYHQIDSVFELKSNGFEHVINFAGMLLWHSEYEERQFLEETQQYEPMIPFLIRKQQQAIKNLNKLSL
jgi:hypothetical protein